MKHYKTVLPAKGNAVNVSWSTAAGPSTNSQQTDCVCTTCLWELELKSPEYVEKINQCRNIKHTRTHAHTGEIELRKNIDTIEVSILPREINSPP